MSDLSTASDYALREELRKIERDIDEASSVVKEHEGNIYRLERRAIAIDAELDRRKASAAAK